MSMIDDVAKTISTFMKDYKAMPEEERPKVLFVIDSLGMLLTPTDVDQFEAGNMKGDMGRKPKALTSLVRNTVNMIGSYNVGMVCTNHTYASQDMFDPDDKISGGQGFIYASSIVIAMRKLKLKEDEDGNKTTTVSGIRAACKVMKTIMQDISDQDGLSIDEVVHGQEDVQEVIKEKNSEAEEENGSTS